MNMKWISVKKTLPPTDAMWRVPYVLAFHSVFGVGVANFWVLYHDGMKSYEKTFNDKYICSFCFIKPLKEYVPDDAVDFHEDDIFEKGPHFKNLGTITHWMPLPETPGLEKIIDENEKKEAFECSKCYLDTYLYVLGNLL